MRLKPKLSKAEFDALDATIREFYVAGSSDDEYVLDTEFEDTSGLKSALEAERKRAREFEKIAKKAEGLDLEELLKLKADKEKNAEDEAKKAGKFDEILQAKEKEWSGKYEAEKQARERLETDYAEKEVESLIVSALSAAKIIPERLGAAKLLARQQAEYERGEDGKLVIKFKDKQGYASPMKSEDFAAQFKEQHDYLFQKNGKEGTGDHSDSRNFDSSKYEGLSAREKLKQAPRK